MPENPSTPAYPASSGPEGAQGAFPVSDLTLRLLALAGVTLIGAGAFSLLNVPTSSTSQVSAATIPVKSAFEDMSIEAKSAFVVDLRTGERLFSKNEHAQLPLASITKMALVLAILEVVDPEERIVISRSAVEKGEGGLNMGEEWRAQDLMDLTLIASSNVGAEALAEIAEPRLRAKYPELTEGNATVGRMNALAKELGLAQTFFMNASGLDVSPTQASAFGSAREVATLAAFAAQKAPDIFAHTASPSHPLGTINGVKNAVLNTNELAGRIPGLLLGKTGSTDLAGGNLVVVFDVGPARPVAIAVLGSTTDGRFGDVLKLVAATHAQVRTAAPERVQ